MGRVPDRLARALLLGEGNVVHRDIAAAVDRRGEDEARIAAKVSARIGGSSTSSAGRARWLNCCGSVPAIGW